MNVLRATATVANISDWKPVHVQLRTVTGRGTWTGIRTCKVVGIGIDCDRAVLAVSDDPDPAPLQAGDVVEELAAFDPKTEVIVRMSDDAGAEPPYDDIGISSNDWNTTVLIATRKER